MDSDVEEGLPTTRTFVGQPVDTPVSASGKIDFKREFVDLVVHHAPEPVYVAHAARCSRRRCRAAAALLATVYPLLSLAAFVANGHGKDSDCGKPADEAGPHAAPPTQRAQRGAAPLIAGSTTSLLVSCGPACFGYAAVDYRTALAARSVRASARGGIRTAGISPVGLPRGVVAQPARRAVAGCFFFRYSQN